MMLLYSHQSHEKVCIDCHCHSATDPNISEWLFYFITWDVHERHVRQVSTIDWHVRPYRREILWRSDYHMFDLSPQQVIHRCGGKPHLCAFFNIYQTITCLKKHSMSVQFASMYDLPKHTHHDRYDLSCFYGSHLYLGSCIPFGGWELAKKYVGDVDLQTFDHIMAK